MNEAAVERYVRWQGYWPDPILTALLVLLSLEVFVGLPLSWSYFPEAPAFAVVWFLLIVAAVLVASRHWVSVAAIFLSALLTLISRRSDGSVTAAATNNSQG